MKTYMLLTPLFVSNLYAQEETTPMYSPEMKTSFQNEQKTIDKGVSREELMGSVQKQSTSVSEGITEVMIIHPEIMAKDWQEAFSTLTNKGTGKVVFHMRDQQAYTNVTAVELLQGGYLMMFTIQGIHGKQYKIIKTSDIQSLTTS